MIPFFLFVRVLQRLKPVTANCDCFSLLVEFQQGQLALAQKYALSVLNSAGKRMVSATVREGTTLYPPGEDRLKNIVTNYTSLTGSDKWLLGSIMLLVFRPLLVDVEAMVSAILA